MGLNVSLGNRNWILVTKEDDLQLRKIASQTGKMSFSGGFTHAASPQASFFKPGTTFQAMEIRKALKNLGVSFPSKEQAYNVWNKIKTSAPLYEYIEESETWYIRYKYSYTGSPYFNNIEWVLYVQRDDDWWRLEINPQNFINLLNVFPFLAGTQKLETASPITQKFILEFAKANCLSSDKDDYTLDNIPQLISLGHAGVAISHNEDLLLIDPVLQSSTIEQRKPSLKSILKLVTAIAISHHHWDHAHIQTLSLIPRNTKIIVSKPTEENFSNPSLASWLKSLGFTNIIEVVEWQTIEIGEIKLTAVPFYGEPFGLSSGFDGFTPYVQTPKFTFYGTVDTGCSEFGNMNQVIERIKLKLPKIDFLFLGCSGQQHDPPFIAGGYKHFSNELVNFPDLIQYHLSPLQVKKWVDILQPKFIVPYAEFIFDGTPPADLEYSTINESICKFSYDQFSFKIKTIEQKEWLDKFVLMANETDSYSLYLAPCQGIFF